MSCVIVARDKFEAAARRSKLREQAVAFKGGRCEICGYSKCIEALDFHHLDSFTKDFTISDRMTSFEAIEAELKKCVLLCANCHREVHAGWHPQYLLRDDDNTRDEWEPLTPDAIDDVLEKGVLERDAINQGFRLDVGTRFRQPAPLDGHGSFEGVLASVPPEAFRRIRSG